MKNTERIWAKITPYKSLYEHMFEAGVVAKTLCERSNFTPFVTEMSEIAHTTTENVINFVSFVCASHDIGKAHPNFQMKSVGEREFLAENGLSVDFMEGFRHESYGSKVLREYLEKFSKDRRVADLISQTVELHHQGKKIDEFAEEISDRKVAKKWNRIQKDLLSQLNAHFNFEKMNFDMERIDLFCHYILFIMVFSDWIASDERMFAEEMRFDTSAEYESYVSEKTVKFLAENNMLYEPLQTSEFEDMFPFIEELNPLQKCVKEIVKEHGGEIALAIIEAPCGEGKTEAGTYLACNARPGKSGLYFGLPTAATAESMFPRINSVLENLNLPQARLFTSLSVFSGTKSGDEDYDAWKLPKRQTLFQSNGVGTVDQLLLSSFYHKYEILRFGGIMNKSIVIDEIHAYDAYMTEIISGGVLHNAKMCGAPVVMLSATLPMETKKKFIEKYTDEELTIEKGYPIITIVTTDGKVHEYICDSAEESKRINFALFPILWDRKKIAKRVNSLVTDGGCACVVMNTVDETVKVYEEIQKIADEDTELILMHARKTVQDRKNDADKVIELFGKNRSKRPEKAILVSTQIVEQSLDVDFDYMLSAIAPIDLLIQRAGRMHRHSDMGTVREKKPISVPFFVFTTLENGYGLNEIIYSKHILSKTDSLLQQSMYLDIPAKNPEYVEFVYSNLSDMDRTNSVWHELNARGSVHYVSERARFSVKQNKDRLYDASSGVRFSEYATEEILLVNSEIYENIMTDNISYKDVKKLEWENVVRVSSNKMKECDEESYIINETMPMAAEKVFCLEENEEGVLGNEYFTYDSTYGLRFI